MEAVAKTESTLPKNSKRHKDAIRTKIVCMSMIVLLLFSLALYLFSRTYFKFWQTGLALTPTIFQNILVRSIPALVAMLVGGAMICSLSLGFQTTTDSRILTPAMIGFDSVYVGTQTILAFLLGASTTLLQNAYLNFFFVAGLMFVISILMYGAVLRKNRNNLVFLLMFGLVLSGIIGSVTNYLQLIMDANDYLILQSITSASINNINSKIVWIATPIMLAVITAMASKSKRYDCIALGRDNAKGLGINFDKEMKLNLILISIGMSAVTALIGSITFLGLLAVNAARELLKTHKHSTMFFVSSLVGAIALIFGQAIVEMLLGALPLTVIIDVVGCLYIFYLILRSGTRSNSL